MKRPILITIATLTGLALAWTVRADPLPSWNDGAAKHAILGFAERTTEDGSPDFVPPAERIAVFDNDGTLWAEQPMYFQFLLTLDRINGLAPQHPEGTDPKEKKGVYGSHH